MGRQQSNDVNLTQLGSGFGGLGGQPGGSIVFAPPQGAPGGGFANPFGGGANGGLSGDPLAQLFAAGPFGNGFNNGSVNPNSGNTDPSQQVSQPDNTGGDVGGTTSTDLNDPRPGGEDVDWSVCSDGSGSTPQVTNVGGLDVGGDDSSKGGFPPNYASNNVGGNNNGGIQVGSPVYSPGGNASPSTPFRLW